MGVHDNKQKVRAFNRINVAAKSSPKVGTGLKDYKCLNLIGSNCAGLVRNNRMVC